MSDLCVQRFAYTLIMIFSWALSFIFMGYAIFVGYITYDEYTYCGLGHVWVISMVTSGITTVQMLVNSCQTFENVRIVTSNVYGCKCKCYIAAILVNIISIVMIMCQLGTYPTKCNIHSDDPLYMLFFVNVFLDIAYISLYGLQMMMIYRYENIMNIRLYDEQGYEYRV